MTDAGSGRQAITNGSGPAAIRTPTFKWVDTALGNIKAAITGTDRAMNSKHVLRYVLAVEYKSN